MAQGDSFHEHLAKVMSSFQPGLFAGGDEVDQVRDNLDLERWFRLLANRQRIASSRSSFFRHRIVDLKVGRSRHFIRQKCRFSPPHGEAARHSRLPFSGGPGSSAWRKSPNIQALPEGATTVADRGFNAAGSQRTSRCSTVGRLHDWHQAKRCAVGSSLPNPKRCAVGKSEAMRCRLALTQRA